MVTTGKTRFVHYKNPAFVSEQQIEHAAAASQSFAAAAKHFGCSEDAFRRHVRKHYPILAEIYTENGKLASLRSSRNQKGAQNRNRNS